MHARQTSTSSARCQSSIKQYNLPSNVASDHHFEEFQTADLNSSIFFTELCPDIFPDRLVYPECCAALNHCSALPRCTHKVLGFFFNVTPTVSNSLNRKGISHLVGLGNYSQVYMFSLCLGINRLPRK